MKVEGKLAATGDYVCLEAEALTVVVRRLDEGVLLFVNNELGESIYATKVTFAEGVVSETDSEGDVYPFPTS